MEIYRPIPDYENYHVSNIGNVKSVRRYVPNKSGKRLVNERILKPALAMKGYPCVSLSVNNKQRTFKVANLVARAFLNFKPTKGYVVDHKDNNKENSHLNNLQIITHRENASKDQKGLSKYTGVSLKKSTGKWVAHININGKEKHVGYFRTELGAYLAYINELEHLKSKDNG